MGTMGPMIEFLLAAERPGGGHLVKFGGMSLTVPIFPAGLSVVFTALPGVVAYASIQYYARWSPAMVPDAFEIAATHAGLFVDVGTINRTMIHEGHNSWIVITEKEPTVTTLTNVSGVDQMFEAEFAYLMVDTAEDLAIVKEIVSGWGSSDCMVAAQNRTNALLGQLITAQGGVLPLPRPPLGGAR